MKATKLKNFAEATPEERPPGATEATARALIKISEDAAGDRKKMTDLISEQIAFFTAALKGLAGEEETRKFLALVSSNTRPMHLVSEEEMEASNESIH